MGKMRCYWTLDGGGGGGGGDGRGGGGEVVSECSGRPIFFFIIIIKENWICAMTRHHGEPNINILLARNLPFDSDVRQ